jgi:hypothetical protein
LVELDAFPPKLHGLCGDLDDGDAGRDFSHWGGGLARGTVGP